MYDDELTEGRCVLVASTSGTWRGADALRGDLCNLVATRDFCQLADLAGDATSLPVSEVKIAETSSSVNLLPEGN